MKPRRPSFGHIDIDYGLDRIFRSSILAFDDASSDQKRIEDVYKKDTSKHSIVPELMKAAAKQRETGTILLISAVAYLEQILYAYAVTFLEPESYEEHLGRASFISRWILVPRLCCDIIIPEDCSEVNDLRELIMARNSVIHPKRHVMNNIRTANKRSEKELRRFLTACKKAEFTVSSARQLLQKK